MSIRHRFTMILPVIATLMVSTLLFAACGSTTSTNPGSTSGSSKPLTSVSIGLGYNPDIQFAPFYVAQSKGYYRNAGLDVTFHHGIVTDLFGTMIAGKNTFVFAGGDELLQAQDKNKGLSVTDVATVFQRYPVSLVVPADSSIKALADFKGHTIGIPGPYGSTYTGLLALLHAGNLSLSDVKVESIGFNQVASLMNHKVDAIVGYSNNEPLQLANNGMQVRTFSVSDYQPLVSNGIITMTNTYHSQSKIVNAFVQATLKGLQDVIAHPDQAVTISQTYVPGLNTTTASKVLNATIPIYKGNGKLGYNDSAIWAATEKFLVNQKMISPVQNMSQFYTNNALSS